MTGLLRQRDRTRMLKAKRRRRPGLLDDTKVALLSEVSIDIDRQIALLDD